MTLLLVTACLSLASGGGMRRRAASWQRIRLATHDRLVDLVAAQLVDGPRCLPSADVHTDVQLSELPVSYGLSVDRGAKRRPDLVAADAARDELLFFEVTIVPDAAVARYAHSKLQKYADLCRADKQQQEASTWRRSLDVIAVGTGGQIPPATWRAFARILQCDNDDRAACEWLAEAAVAIAAERPDAPHRRGTQPQPAGGSRRQRRRQRGGKASKLSNS